MDLAEAVLGEVSIPLAVADEIRPSVGRPPSWVRVRTIWHPPPPRDWRVQLECGEREAIALATDLNADLHLLDDLQARKEAQRLGVSISGSIGVILEAHRLGPIDDVQLELEAMLEVGFQLSTTLYAKALVIAAQ